MNTVFDRNTILNLHGRIDLIDEQSKALWGKMNVFQMLRHCCENERMLLKKKSFKPVFIGKLFGRLALKKILSDGPIGKNKPTHPDLKIRGDGDLLSEKTYLKKLLWEYLVVDSDTFKDFKHPFFGKMAKDEIGIFAYKHTDHHLRQFGV